MAFKVPTNPHCVPKRAQVLMTELQKCHAASDIKKGSYYKVKWRKSPNGRNRTIDVLEAMQMVERYGTGWITTPIGNTVLAEFIKDWSFVA